MKRIELKVRYYLEYLQIKNNSLFTHIKVYLISDESKKIVAQDKQIKNNRVDIETAIEENKIFIFNQVRQLYEASLTTIQLQFQAEGKFIKMGQTVINVADIVNSNRSGHSEAFRIEKCLDRNARLWIKMVLYPQLPKGNNSLQQSESYNKMSEIYSTRRIVTPERPQVYKTENSMVEQEQNRDNYDILSSAKTHFPTKKYRPEWQNVQKTKMPKLIYQESQELVQLHEELQIANTDLRLTTQQLAAIKANYFQLLKVSQELEIQLRQSHTEHFKMANHCDELQEKINRLQLSLESQRDNLNLQARKYMALYHQSQQERNKLLMQSQQKNREERQKRRDLEKKLIQSQDRIKSLQNKVQQSKRQLIRKSSEIQSLKKTIYKDHTSKNKQQQQINSLKATIQKIDHEHQLQNQQNKKLKQQNDELLNELELCRFSIAQLQKQILQSKQMINKKEEAIEKYKTQIERAKEARQKDMYKYSTQLEKVQQQAKQEYRSLQDYIEELESKTINDYSKLNQLEKLRRQITTLNNLLIQEQDKFKELQSDHQYLLVDKRNIQQRLQEQQALTLKLTREKAILQSSLKLAQQEQTEILQALNSQHFTQQEKELIITRCCEERDHYWQGEVDKVQRDTLILIDKLKKERQSFNFRIEELCSELKSKESEIFKFQQKNKQLEGEMREQKNKLVEKNGQSKALEFQVDKLLSELATKEKKIQHQIDKINSLQAIEATLDGCEAKLALKIKQIARIKTELQLEKNDKIKQKKQIIKLITAITNLLINPQKFTFGYLQLKTQVLDSESSILLSSAVQTYCERHNKAKQQIQSLKEQLGKKQRQVQKTNKSLLEKKSASYKYLNKCQTEGEELFLSPNAFRSTNRSPNKEENHNLAAVTILKQQILTLGQRLQRQENKNKEQVLEIQRIQRNKESLQSQIKRLSDQIDQKSQQVSNLLLKLTSKENQILSCREELKDTMSQLTQTKARLQETNRLQQQQRAKALSKKIPTFNNTSPSKADQYLKIIELERILQLNQEELERAKRQREEKRREQGSTIKQIKQLQIKIREKDSIISELKKQVELEKNRSDQQKEMFLLREKKFKQELEEQGQKYYQAERDLKQKVNYQQQRVREGQEKIKRLQDHNKNLTAQIANMTEKEAKTKRMLTTESQLKIKSLEIQHQNQQAILKRMIQEQKLIEKSLREKIQVKEVQFLRLTNEIQKYQLIIEDLKAQIDVNRMKISNFEEDESQFKETIEVLENKIKFNSNKSSHKSIQKEAMTLQLRSNPSLADFSFR